MIEISFYQCALSDHLDNKYHNTPQGQFLLDSSTELASSHFIYCHTCRHPASPLGSAHVSTRPDHLSLSHCNPLIRICLLIWPVLRWFLASSPLPKILCLPLASLILSHHFISLSLFSFFNSIFPSLSFFRIQASFADRSLQQWIPGTPTKHRRLWLILVRVDSLPFSPRLKLLVSLLALITGLHQRVHSALFSPEP